MAIFGEGKKKKRTVASVKAQIKKEVSKIEVREWDKKLKDMRAGKVPFEAAKRLVASFK